MRIPPRSYYEGESPDDTHTADPLGSIANGPFSDDRFCVSFPLNTPLLGQTALPDSIFIDSGAICTGGSETFPVKITLPPDSIIDEVDVFFLFDDTGSFASFVLTVTGIFSGLVGSLETALPTVEFGFGVGRFEDCGGDGDGFSGEFLDGRPFILNQPIVTAADAGGPAARDLLIGDALINEAPGFGGDGPESDIETLSQLATGAGFDGNGDGDTTDSGDAGALATQTAPGTSGDVPAFSPLAGGVVSSGTLGGAGWRSGALHIVILATDTCSVSPFPVGGIPATITGAGASSEPVTAFACTSTTPGSSRFGFVSDSKTSPGTVAGEVAPSESATVQATVDALNALGIRVIGMGPGASPTGSPGPSSGEDVLLSALARLTGAVDGLGNPLVFSTSVPLGDLSDAIEAAIATTVTEPVDITLAASALPAGLSMSFTPSQVDDVPPGGMAPFDLILTGNGDPINGTLDLDFVDVNSGAVLGTIPVTVACPIETNAAPICTDATADPSQLWPPNHKLVPVGISGVTDPDGDAVTIVATSVTQDEQTTGKGQGAGNTSPDASIDGNGAVAVRSERNGNPKTPGDGRVYHISFTATDPSGLACSGIVDVCVPHDQGNGNSCVDGGPLFSSIP